MKKRILQLLIITLLITTIAVGVFYFEKPEDKAFGVEKVKNSVLEIHCPLQFEDGRFESENLKDHCEMDLPIKKFKAQLYDLKLVEDRVVGFLETFDGNSRSYELISVDEFGNFTSRKLEEEPDRLAFQEDLFIVYPQKISFKELESKFIKITDETERLDSLKYQFSIEIPINWSYEKEEGVYIFFHEDFEKYSFKMDPEERTVELKIPDEMTFRKEIEKIKRSLQWGDVENLPDYRFFKDQLEDYLEVNTVTGQIDHHFNGKKERFEVLAAGDPEGWNGTPSGLYSLKSKEGLRFSTESEVFMPYSMRLYGKYLIHGEAYYPSGIPYTSAVSGGCIRVRNEEMSRLYDSVEVGLPILSITHEKEDFNLRETRLTKKPEIGTESFLVVDIDSGRVLLGKNYEEKREITDLTKLMTAIVATEQLGVTEPIIARNYMLEDEDEDIYFSSGRRFRLVDLLAPLLVESSDNAARVLSHYLGRDNTLDRVNQKAEAIGMKETRFKDSFGIEKSETSARDLYYLTYYLTNTRKPILDITRGVWVPHIDYEVFGGMKNQNIFYGEDDFLGGKFEINEGGLHNGVFLFNQKLGNENRKLAFIMLGTPTEKDLLDDITEVKKWLSDSFNQ